MNNRDDLTYLITVSRAHILPTEMLIATIKQTVENPKIVLVGNLSRQEAEKLKSLGALYIDEELIDLTGRFPEVTWTKKIQRIGWYKQQLIRLCIDRFLQTEYAVILDSEAFFFKSWDESRLFDLNSKPRHFHWIASKRKSDWDYTMYKGSAYLLSFLPQCKGIMEYANSDDYKRRITGMSLFSRTNVQALWELLEKETDLEANLDILFNREDLAFAENEFYGLAVEYGLFDQNIPTVMHDHLLGWYDNHDDPVFNCFKENAMWSMCQSYFQYTTPDAYLDFMQSMASTLKQELPDGILEPRR